MTVFILKVHFFLHVLQHLQYKTSAIYILIYKIWNNKKGTVSEDNSAYAYMHSSTHWRLTRQTIGVKPRSIIKRMIFYCLNLILKFNINLITSRFLLFLDVNGPLLSRSKFHWFIYNFSNNSIQIKLRLNIIWVE